MIDNFRCEYFFLSNFYPCKINYKGNVFPSLEHAYQWAKNPNDPKWLAFCLDTNNSKELKREAKKIKLSSEWYIKRVCLMRELLNIKFSDSELAQKLMYTWPHELIEGNWWGDTFWGVHKGIGQNKLGKLLMEIRDGILNDYGTL